MTGATQNGKHPGSQRPPEAPDAPFVAFDLTAQIELLRREPAYEHGRSSGTLAKYPDLRVVLIVIRGGERMCKPSAVGRTTVQTVTAICTPVFEKLIDLPAGRLVALRRSHDVEAVEDSAFLITFGPQ